MWLDEGPHRDLAATLVEEFVMHASDEQLKKSMTYLDPKRALLKTHLDLLVVVKLSANFAYVINEIKQILDYANNIKFILISRANTNLGLGELRYELKPLSPLQRAAMFFKIAEPYLLQKGKMMQHYKMLSETCEQTRTTNLSQLRDSQIFEVLSEHDLFVNLTNGLPEQIHSIAQSK